MALCAGLGAIFAFLPSLLKRDNNNDGISDLAQKSQNAYKEGSNKIENMAKEAGRVAQFVEIFR